MKEGRTEEKIREGRKGGEDEGRPREEGHIRGEHCVEERESELMMMMSIHSHGCEVPCHRVTLWVGDPVLRHKPCLKQPRVRVQWHVLAPSRMQAHTDTFNHTRAHAQTHMRSRAPMHVQTDTRACTTDHHFDAAKGECLLVKKG